VGPLDGKIVGLLAAHMTIIPARPSMGKSSLARQIIAGGIRRDHPRRQVVFSCEVDRGTFNRLLVAEMCGASLSDVAAHIHHDVHVPGLSAAFEKLSHTPVWIDDTASPTPGEIVRRVRSFADRHGPPDVVVIDHWHLLTHPREKGEREDTAQERGSRMLRALAKDIGAAVVVCAQLTKAGGRGRPTMEDIRECDALAQDAAQIVAPYRPLFRPDAPRPELAPGEVEEPEDAELIVLKNRYGRTGVASAKWIGGLTRYV
jgi:replicative DNA helicase